MPSLLTISAMVLLLASRQWLRQSPTLEVQAAPAKVYKSFASDGCTHRRTRTETRTTLALEHAVLYFYSLSWQLLWGHQALLPSTLDPGLVISLQGETNGASRESAAQVGAESGQADPLTVFVT